MEQDRLRTSPCPPQRPVDVAYVGLIEGDGRPTDCALHAPRRLAGRINRHVDVIHSGPPPAPDAPIILQASRWDGMKDMPGVMQGFAEHVDLLLGAHLILAGPAVSGVADDTRGGPVFEDCVSPVGTNAPTPSPAARTSHASMADADGGRRDRQRPPTPRHGRLPEEPGRRLRPHRRRGHVEAESPSSQAPSAASPTTRSPAANTAS